MVILIYDSLLALLSLGLNDISALGPQFSASILVGLFLTILYSIYLVVWVRPFRLF